MTAEPSDWFDFRRYYNVLNLAGPAEQQLRHSPCVGMGVYECSAAKLPRARFCVRARAFSSDKTCSALWHIKAVYGRYRCAGQTTRPAPHCGPCPRGCHRDRLWTVWALLSRFRCAGQTTRPAPLVDPKVTDRGMSWQSSKEQVLLLVWYRGCAKSSNSRHCDPQVLDLSV